MTAEQDAPSFLERLLSPDAGVVNRVDEGTAGYDHPRLASCFARTCATGHVLGMSGTGESGGVAASVHDARLAALGEAVERYSACWVPRSRLRHARRTALPPADVVGPDLIDDGGEERAIHWVPGARLRPDGSSEPAWVAASRVYLDGIDCTPGTAVTTSTGLACHHDAWRALRSGLLECIERDAVMVAWLSRSGATPIRCSQRWVDSHGVPVRFDRAVERYALYALASPTGIPVVFAVALGAAGQPPVAVGAAADLDPARACRKALLEAYQTFTWCRHMLLQRRVVPQRADVVDLDDHVAFYLDPGRLEAFDFLLDDDNLPTSWELDIDTLAPVDDPAGDVRRLVTAAAGAGWACYAVDVTAPDVREAGGWVVRAVVPDAHPLTVGTEIRSSHPRLVGTATPNPWPHPFP